MTEHADGISPVSGHEALARLIAGNERFVRGATVHTRPHNEKLEQLAKGQRPFAAILGCSDSRVPPELVFDQSLGDLFIVRLPGNVVSAEVAGGLEYALVHLRVPLLLVMGHEGCWAVQAAVALKSGVTAVGWRLQVLLRDVLPALEGIDGRLPAEEQMRQAVEANVGRSMRHLAQIPEGELALAENRPMMVGAVYEIRTGRVRFLAC